MEASLGDPRQDGGKHPDVPHRPDAAVLVALHAVRQVAPAVVQGGCHSRVRLVVPLRHDSEGRQGSLVLKGFFFFKLHILPRFESSSFFKKAASLLRLSASWFRHILPQGSFILKVFLFKKSSLITWLNSVQAYSASRLVHF